MTLNQGRKYLFVATVVLIIAFTGLYIQIDKQAEHVRELGERQLSTERALVHELEQRDIFYDQQFGTLQNSTRDLLSVLSKYVEDSEKNAAQAQQQLAQLHAQVTEINRTGQELHDKIGDGADFTQLLPQVLPSVLHIRTDKKSGSGVLYHTSGKAYTNKHVVKDATTITVVDHLGRSYNAELLQESDTVDLATIQFTNVNQLPAMPIATAGTEKQGLRVIAIGSPLGLSFSVTEGIISGTNRKVDGSDTPYIQIDVPINPGNSGGPLITKKGELLGITTLKIQGAESIGFAIPSSTLLDFDTP